MRVNPVYLALVLGAVLLASCGGGGGSSAVSPGQTPQQHPGGGSSPQASFAVRISADQTSGPSPLTVNFSAVPLGGDPPYFYQWYFDGFTDTTVDSTLPSPHHTFTTSTVVRVVIIDSQGRVGEASISIFVDDRPIPRPPGFEVRIAAFDLEGNPFSAGVVPTTVAFRSAVIGGEPPYSYEWDFEGDGIPDSFVANPQHTFTTAGTPTDHDGDPSTPPIPVHNVTLTVTDGRGSKATATLPLTLSVQGLTISLNASPTIGQAPLTVDFTAAVSGGQSPYMFAWEFGDGTNLDFQPNSTVSHTYIQTGRFFVRVTVKDAAGQITTSAPVIVDVVEEQPLEVTITADITESAVPFISSFTSIVTGGKAPFIYNWVVNRWNDIDQDGEVDVPDEIAPLDPASIVVPMTSTKPNPQFHFANNTGTMKVVRLGVTDANGSSVFSDWIPIVTHDPELDYFASKFNANPPQGALKHMFDTTPPMNPTSPPGGRVHPVVLGHPSGVVFIFGGEVVDAAGNLVRTVSRNDAAWAIRVAFTDDEEDIGAYADSLGPFADGINLGEAYPANTWVQLNTFRSNPFPTQPNPGWQPPPSATNPNFGRATNLPFGFDQQFDPDGPGGGAPPQPAVLQDQQRWPARQPIQRSTNFFPVGMAAGALVYEPVVTNPVGNWSIYNLDPANCPQAFQSPPTYGFFQPLPQPSEFPDYLLPLPMKAAPALLPPGNWRVATNTLPGGVLTAYIIGGRSDQPTPNSEPAITGDFFVSADVQKYVVPGFGAEDLPLDNVDLVAGEQGGTLMPCVPPAGFQITNNQVDAWISWYHAPDNDQIPADDNLIQIAPPATGLDISPELPLPDPLYGHQVLVLDSREVVPPPVFPEQPYLFIAVLGGKKPDGQVTGEMLLRDINQAPGNQQGGDQQQRPFGQWSLEAELTVPRWDFNAQVIPPKLGQAQPWRIVVWGGLDANNQPVREIEMLEFADPNAFNGADVLQFQVIGELPESFLRKGSYGGYTNTILGIRLFDAAGEGFSRFRTDILSFGTDEGGSQLVHSLQVSPRKWAGASMISLGHTAFGANDSDILVGSNPRLNRIVVFGGMTEDGQLGNWIEVYTGTQ